MLAIPALTSSTFEWPFTPVDAINLLDKVLLHEFTHTHACGRLADVSVSQYRPSTSLLRADRSKVTMPIGGAPTFGKAYGWNAATTLARQQDNDLQKSPLRNSDTFALFASGMSTHLPTCLMERELTCG